MTNKNDMVDKDKIYAVKFPGDKQANSLAMNVDPNYKNFKGICFLTPFDRGHMIEGKLGRKTKTGFTFISSGFASGEWEFIELTYENFCNDYRRLVEGSDEILAKVKNTQELQDWYHGRFTT